MTDAILQQLQFKYKTTIKPQWLQETIVKRGSDDKVLGDELLHSQIHDFAHSCLPVDIQTLHNVTLSGSFLLQIEEIIDVGISLQTMYEALTMRMEGISRRGRIMSDEPSTGALPRSMLRLLLTDGTTKVFAMEYKPLPIDIESSLGSKVIIKNAVIKRGVLMLTPSCFAFLGGQVQSYNHDRIWYGLVKQHARMLMIPEDQIPRRPSNSIQSMELQNAPQSDEFDDLPDEAFEDLPLEELHNQFDDIPIEDIPNDVFDHIQQIEDQSRAEQNVIHQDDDFIFDNGQILSDIDLDDAEIHNSHISIDD